MKIRFVLKDNWLTKKVPAETLTTTLLWVLALLAGSFIYVHGFFHSEQWMAASKETVIQKGEYWRLWTTLFAHADIGHIFSNLILFFPFAYFLTGYFGSAFFPIAGFFVGGIVNWLVLKTMPDHTYLVGVSGVVYWMGAAWTLLYLLIDRRESLKKRILKSIGVSLLLFIPESYRPEVSYLTHFLGYVTGALSGAIWFAMNKKKFRASEQYKIEVELDEEDENPTCHSGLRLPYNRDGCHLDYKVVEDLN